MELTEVLPRLHLISLSFGQAYLWQDPDGLTLVDTGVAGSGADIAEALRRLGFRRRDLRRVVLTHFHGDHIGSAAELRGWGDVSVLAHRLDAPVIRGERAGPPPVLLDWERPIWDQVHRTPWAAPPPVGVDRELSDGDTLDIGGGATVVGVPGHTAGSIAIHLPAHGVLFTGDALANVERPMLGVFNVDRGQAVASLRRLAGLDVRTVCGGHGGPIVADAAALLRAASVAAS